MKFDLPSIISKIMGCASQQVKPTVDGYAVDHEQRVLTCDSHSLSTVTFGGSTLNVSGSGIASISPANSSTQTVSISDTSNPIQWNVPIPWSVLLEGARRTMICALKDLQIKDMIYTLPEDILPKTMYIKNPLDYFHKTKSGMILGSMFRKIDLEKDLIGSVLQFYPKETLGSYKVAWVYEESPDFSLCQSDPNYLVIMLE